MVDVEIPAGYEKPEIRFLGSLADMTGACMGFGGEDGAAKANHLFVFSSPDFGDPGLCGGP